MQPYTPEWAADDLRRAGRRPSAASPTSTSTTPASAQTIEIDGKTLPYRPVSMTLGKTVNNGWGGYECCWARTLLAVPGRRAGSARRHAGHHGAAEPAARRPAGRASSPAPTASWHYPMNPTDKAHWSPSPNIRNAYRTHGAAGRRTRPGARRSGPTHFSWMFQKETPEDWPHGHRCPTSGSSTAPIRRSRSGTPRPIGKRMARLPLRRRLRLHARRDQPHGRHPAAGGDRSREPAADPHRRHQVHRAVLGPRGLRAAPAGGRAAGRGARLHRDRHRTGARAPACWRSTTRRSTAARRRAAQGRELRFLASIPSSAHDADEIWDAVCRAASAELTDGARGARPGLVQGARPRAPGRSRSLTGICSRRWTKQGLRFELPYQERLLARRRGARQPAARERHALVGQQLEEYQRAAGVAGLSRASGSRQPSKQAGGKPEDFPFWLLTSRSMQYAWGGNVGIQLINEVADNVAGHRGVIINARTAARTGHRRRRPGRGALRTSAHDAGPAVLRQGIRPDTLLMIGQFDHWATPFAKDFGVPSLNSLVADVAGADRRHRLRRRHRARAAVRRTRGSTHDALGHDRRSAPLRRLPDLHRRLQARQRHAAGRAVAPRARHRDRRVSRTCSAPSCRSAAMHCDDPPCMHVCPTTATDQARRRHRRPSTTTCASAAPTAPSPAPTRRATSPHRAQFAYGGSRWRRRRRASIARRMAVATKCTFCVDRIDAGQANGQTPGVDPEATPACVNSCIAGALAFGDIEDPQSNVSQLLAENAALPHARGAGHRARLLLHLGQEDHERWPQPLAPDATGTGAPPATSSAAAPAAACCSSPRWPLARPIAYRWQALIALALIGAGLTCVWLEIGRPLRALNVFRHPHTSWMTREAMVAPLFLCGSWPSRSGRAAARSPASPRCSAWSSSTARRACCAAAKGIPAWREPKVIPLMIATGLAEGAGLATLLAAVLPGSAPRWLAGALLGALILRRLAWKMYCEALAKQRRAEEGAGGAARASAARFAMLGQMPAGDADRRRAILRRSELRLAGAAGGRMPPLSRAGALKFTIVGAGGLQSGLRSAGPARARAGPSGPGVKPGWTRSAEAGYLPAKPLTPGGKQGVGTMSSVAWRRRDVRSTHSWPRRSGRRYWRQHARDGAGGGRQVRRRRCRPSASSGAARRWSSFLRFDDREIRQMTNIYTPDCLLCIDPTVAHAVEHLRRHQATAARWCRPPPSRWPNCSCRHRSPRSACATPSPSRSTSSSARSPTPSCSAPSPGPPASCRWIRCSAALEDSDFRDAGLKQNLAALERGYNETQVHHIERRAAA